MSKQAKPPPPGDKPVPTAPPRPPRWRDFVWLIALIAAFALWLILPTVHSTPTTSLTYSQFITDVNQHKVKTIDIAPAGGTSTGTLTSGTELHGGHPAAGRPDAADPAAVRRRDGVRADDRDRASAPRC